jgi:hypothetical protein
MDSTDFSSSYYTLDLSGKYDVWQLVKLENVRSNMRIVAWELKHMSVVDPMGRMELQLKCVNEEKQSFFRVLCKVRPS